MFFGGFVGVVKTSDKPNWKKTEDHWTVTVAACLHRGESSRFVHKRSHTFIVNRVSLWWNGPDWLTKDFSEWSKMQVPNRPSEMPEMKISKRKEDTIFVTKKAFLNWKKQFGTVTLLMCWTDIADVTLAQHDNVTNFSNLVIIFNLLEF